MGIWGRNEDDTIAYSGVKEIEVYWPSGKLSISFFFLVGLDTIVIAFAGRVFQLLVNWTG